MNSRYLNSIGGGLLSLCLLANTHAATPALKLFSDGFTGPTALVPLPDGQFVLVDQVGKAFVLGKNGSVRDQPFLDVTDRMIKLNEGFDERGMLGLELHPKYSSNGKFYVYYSAPKEDSTPEGWDHRTHVSEFKADPTKAIADAASERILMEWDQPFFNHNGGSVEFGPDGFLYIAAGDGGRANDTQKRYKPEIGNGQNTETFLGKILRIDVDNKANGKPYGIPSDNPFVKGGGLPEIYAYGMRNPWRISFDRGGTHQLFAADIGQTLYEEVDIIEKGGNYGWFIKEGFIDFDPKNARKAKASNTKVGYKGEPLIDPVIIYKNANGWPRDKEALGISITGGYVYRGKAIPSLAGKYIFADYKGNIARPGGVLLVSTPQDTKPWPVNRITLDAAPDGRANGLITAFGEDNDGELYVLINEKGGLNGPVGTTGKVYKLVP